MTTALVLGAGGLTGGQGVLLPAANEANLVLMPDVAEAVAAGLESQAVRWRARIVDRLRHASELERCDEGARNRRRCVRLHDEA